MLTNVNHKALTYSHAENPRTSIKNPNDMISLIGSGNSWPCIVVLNASLDDFKIIKIIKKIYSFSKKLDKIFACDMA